MRKTTPASDIRIAVPEVNSVSLRTAYGDWTAQNERYSILKDYYLGNHDFSKSHEDGNRIVANFCNYIPKALRGYMFGNKPRYVCAEGDAQAKTILDLFDLQDKWLIDSMIGLDMSIYGKAFELVYIPEGKTEPNSVVIPPQDAFVVYDGSMEKDSVFGAVRFAYKDDKGQTKYRLSVYDRTNFMTWESGSDNQWTLMGEPVPHGFGRVPLIEYKNNREMAGDFEPILDLQDAYNSVLSDRQDDKDAFASAMLMLQGSIMGATPDEIEQGASFLKKHRILQLDEDSVAQWLTKTLDEAGTQILQDQLARDIHKFAMVPDLSDEAFAGNASGVAMAYKLFGTDQMVAEKIAQFRRGFTRRCKLYDWRMHNPSNNPAYEPVADIKAMTIEFILNTPQDLTYMATALPTLTSAKIISRYTARKELAMVDDPEEEEKRVQSESEADMEASRQEYDYDPIDEAMRQDDAEEKPAEADQ